MKTMLGLVAFSVLSTTIGCAAQPRVAPQLAVAVAASMTSADNAPKDEISEAGMLLLGERTQHHVEITVDKLPQPQSVHGEATTYVFWVRAEEGQAWANAAHLNPSDATQEAVFGYPEDILFVHVTAEPTADARIPSTAVLLSTRVTKNGACASMVDDNKLEMRVRMCSDEKAKR